MAEKDIIMMRRTELKKLHVLKQLADKKIKQTSAAEVLGLSSRQVRRLILRIKEEGEKGIIHRLRGKASHRRIPGPIRERIIKLYRSKYEGFGPTLASEKLFEIHKIKISDETLRNWLISSGDWQKRRKRHQHRRWRERKDCYGQMVQIDGSHHNWFEGRAPCCVLMGYIDDATNRTYARFYRYEGVKPAMDSFKRYISKYGLPHSIYIDKHATYKSPARPSIEDELEDRDPQSNFERAMAVLGVEVIHAHSPQAKGRIERLFKTLQDRLVKELRLRKIANIGQANQFLENYLPAYNRRFSTEPKQKANMHRPLGQSIDLDAVLCAKEKRFLRNDCTILYKGRIYQIMHRLSARWVSVEDRLEAGLCITHNNRRLKYKLIHQRSRTKKTQPAPRRIHRPPLDHPLKRGLFNARRQVDPLKIRALKEVDELIALNT